MAENVTVTVPLNVRRENIAAQLAAALIAERGALTPREAVALFREVHAALAERPAEGK